MRPLFYFFIISIIVFYSCDSKKNNASQSNKTTITGKWHRFSFSNGYTEFDIDSQYVIFFNQKTGRIKLGYTIENDSFKYIGHDYAARLKNCGDSILLWGNDGSTATLYRFSNATNQYNDIPEEKDVLLFESYLKGYDQRMISEYEKAGIVFSDSEYDTMNAGRTFHQLHDYKVY